MKKLLITLFVCVISLHVFSQTPENGGNCFIEWEVGYVKPWQGSKPIPKSPEVPPTAPEATLENNVLTFQSAHDAYTLTLVDEDAEAVYEVNVPSNVNVVVLPATIVGDFELQLDYGGNYYFYCEINL